MHLTAPVPAAAASSKPGTLLPVLHPNAAEREGKTDISYYELFIQDLWKEGRKRDYSFIG